MAPNDYERYLHEQLHRLRLEYEKNAKLFIDELVKIEQTRVRPWTITIEQYESVRHLLADHKEKAPDQ